jgi:hypothetical protein
MDIEVVPLSAEHSFKQPVLAKPEYELSPAHESELLDPRRFDNSLIATCGIDEVYCVTSDIEITGYISAFHAELLAHCSFVTFS